MKIMITKMIITITSIFLFLLLIPAGCGGGGGGGGGSSDAQVAKEAEVKIGAFMLGETTTVFRVTLKSVSGLSGASSYNLVGDDTSAVAQSAQPFNTQVENYVVNSKTITLEVYNAAGDTLASTTLDANDFAVGFEGTFNLDQGKPVSNSVAARVFDNASAAPATAVQRSVNSRTQIGNLDILASGIIDDLTLNDVTREIQVPLTCGPNTTGTIQPDPGEGFFIINDVIIEFNYAFDNPVSFNNVFTTKFIESDRNFDNMRLYFRLPGRTQIINARTGLVLNSGEVATVFDGLTQAVNATNPFGGTGIAYVDLRVTQFGPSKLVETTVTRVEGNCVVGARSFTVKESSEAAEPPKALNDRLDKNTLESSLILYILGNEVEVRDQSLTACDSWFPAQSGGSAGTLDIWDISTIPSGASFDIKYNARQIPDKFEVEYPAGTVKLDTGWRGDSSYSSSTPGPIVGPGADEVLDMFTKGASDTIRVIVTGNPSSSTVWDYSLRCTVQGTGGGTNNSLIGSWVGCDGRVVTFTLENGEYIGRYTELGGLGAFHFTENEVGYILTKDSDGKYTGTVKWRDTSGTSWWKSITIDVNDNMFTALGSDSCSSTMSRKGTGGNGSGQYWPGIKGLWRKSDGIEVRFTNESEGYYEEVGFLADYNFKKGDLGYRVNKVDPTTYDMDIKFCYMNSSTPCFWNKNYTLVIVDENTMKETDSLIWTRIGN